MSDDADHDVYLWEKEVELYENGTLADYHAELTREECGDLNCEVHKDSFYDTEPAEAARRG